jgi:hypothetical protein
MLTIWHSKADAARSEFMNIATYAPSLALMYVFVLLWILMGVDLKSFSRRDRWVIPLVVLFLCFANDLLRKLVGQAVYSKLLILTMHLPTFFLFLYIAKRGFIKTFFMILTALVFTAPTMIISNTVRRFLGVDAALVLLLSNLISYVAMLSLAWFVLRKSFTYLMIYGDSRFFLIFSILPVVFYSYLLVGANQDFSSLNSFSGYVIRWLPIIEAFSFYFLIPYIYQSLREKMLIQSTQDALQQEISSAEDQIALLNETNQQMAVYRHDVRHHINLLNGLLADGKIERAQEVLNTSMADLDAITPKRYCENEPVNLLCSSYDSKAKRLGVQLKINALLPKEVPLSDTELCSVISNGLENALRAASQPEVAEKWVGFSCYVRQGNIFMLIQNPYAGQVVIRDGLPVSSREGHGYGCYSIQAITQRNGGLCSFEAENGVFSLRLSFPLPDDYGNQIAVPIKG